MAKLVYYPVLEGKISERGFTKLSIAKSLGISPRALSNKTSGKVPFTWAEACIIHDQYFPDIPKDSLFARNIITTTPG